ncbi:MAG TPA: hypothetical protein VKY24_19820 [Reyranella sp.]|nr:hypothetical protein [Reyranella sp.]
MAARKKSASRRIAAKAKSKKAAKPPNAKKAARKKAPVPSPARKKAAIRRRPGLPPKAPSPALVDIDRRIALVQNNLRDLMEQAAATSGSANEEVISDRITRQEAELQRLRQERDALAKSEDG